MLMHTYIPRSSGQVLSLFLFKVNYYERQVPLFVVFVRQVEDCAGFFSALSEMLIRQGASDT